MSQYKELWIIAGGNHNNTFLMAGPAYFVRVNQFFEKCLNPEFLAKNSTQLADAPEDLTTKQLKTAIEKYIGAGKPAVVMMPEK